MRDLSDFEKGQIVGARMAGASLTKTAELLVFSRATISRTMSELKNTSRPPTIGAALVGLLR